MRKLVTLRKITNIAPIKDADAIELASIDGWNVVVKKGEFEVGDYVIYFEVDSILPQGREEFDFLMARSCKLEPNEHGEAVMGHRLKTIKLRGQISQGLVIPVPSNFVIYDTGVEVWEGDDYTFQPLDADFSFHFGVTKYEKPVSAELAGLVRGNYPAWLPKTDQERVQNLRYIPNHDYAIEEKVEGSSMTIYWDGHQVGVTSRNVDLRLDQDGNTFVDVAKASGLLGILSQFSPDVKVAIRGELIGPGIQGNIYKLTKHEFRVFDVFMNGSYLTQAERDEFMLGLDEYNEEIVKEVPRVGLKAMIAVEDDLTPSDFVVMADGASLIMKETLREGLVFKSLWDPSISFKAISPKYLLKQKD